MTAPPFIRLRPDGIWEWLPDGPAAPCAQGSLAEAAAFAAGRPPVILVPGERVTLVGAGVPTRNRARMLQALPYALEERLADDVETLHFAPGAVQDRGSVAAAVVARRDMEQWLRALDDAGLQPQAVSPDSLGVPFEDGTWSVLCEPGRCLVRTGAQSGWAAEPDNLDVLLSSAVACSAGAPECIRVLVAPGAAEPELPRVYARADGHPVPIALEAAPHSPLALLAGGWEAPRAIDLLQGSQRRRSAAGGEWKRWRTAAAVAVLLVGAEIGFTAFQAQQLAAESRRLGERITAVYQEAFPEARRVVNARVQMQQGLDALRAGSGVQRAGLLALLERVAPLLSAHSGVSLTGLRYRDRRLELDLTAPDFQSLDRLRQRLAESSLAAELASASSADAGVYGRLTVTPEDVS